MKDCNKCVYSTRDGGCTKVECEFKTVVDIRADAIDEYKNKLWEDIETRYKNDIKILGYLSAENLLTDVHNSICYFAKKLK